MEKAYYICEEIEATDTIYRCHYRTSIVQKAREAA